MQYWIFYYQGVGGDGFVNLLDHCNEASNYDYFPLQWRVYSVVNGRIRFAQAHWTEMSDCGNYPLRTSNTQDMKLNPEYVRLVESNATIFVPTHYTYWEMIDSYKHRPVVEKNQVKIHLYSDNYARVARDNIVKNRWPEPNLDFEIRKAKRSITTELNNSAYHAHIDIEQIWSSWQYTKDCLSTLGLTLDEKVYQQYLSFLGKHEPDSAVLQNLKNLKHVSIIEDPNLPR